MSLASTLIDRGKQHEHLAKSKAQTSSPIAIQHAAVRNILIE